MVFLFLNFLEIFILLRSVHPMAELIQDAPLSFADRRLAERKHQGDFNLRSFFPEEAFDDVTLLIRQPSQAGPQ